VVTERSFIDAAVQRETLRMALRNSSRSVPLQLVAVGFFVVLGFGVELRLIAVLIGLVGVGVAAWRYSLSKRYSEVSSCTDADCFACRRSLSGMQDLPASCGQ
jgi:hypothetical protein